MKKQLFNGAALIALAIPAAAYAQSTGTIAAEESTIVVTGSRSTGIQGVQVPNAPKAQTIVGQELIATQSPGQSVIQIINIVPSVNFTNNDPYGGSGGNVRIRGFDGNRISLTFDGMPLNDTGNYAIFSNQQLDPEIIDQVNVNQGTTDVDSPTAASSGGTINYRSITPSTELGARVVASVGSFDYNRVFGMLQSGEFTSFGTRMFGSISYAKNDKFRGAGQIRKQQYNIKFYQPLAGTDFISIAGHFNKNRNNSYRQLTLAQARTDFAANGRFDFDNNAFCVRPTFRGGTAQNEAATPQVINGVSIASVTGTTDTSCTNYFGVRLNPSDTGNLRINSKFSLADNLVLTVDPSFQYVLANGGGFTTQAENSALVRGNRFATTPTAGVDLSRDGDTLDTVAFYSPNTTNTYRYGLLSSLRWDFAEGQYLRLAYALDYGRHRQTGEWTFLDAVGNPLNVFGGRTGNGPKVFNADGYALRQRDRFSIATLNQVSAEYRGRFFDDALEVMLGARLPFFNRKLNQYCYTIVTTGNPLCTSQTLGTTAAAGTNYIVPNNFVPPATGLVGTPVFAPFRQEYNFKRFLPNVGLTFRPVERVSIFAAFAKGLSAPRTDNLYRSPFVGVAPETTTNFDGGIRYTSSLIQASVGGFYNRFKNRIVTSFDQEQGISIDRNVGRVEIKGLEASADVRPLDFFTFRGFVSYIDAKYKDNTPGTTAGTVFQTAGKKLVETPTWQYGYRAQLSFDPVQVGLQFKKVTSRFATDVNDVKVPGYSTFDADVRFNLEPYGLEKTYLQFNAVNLFNTRYLGSINSAINLAGNPQFQIGSPRALIGTLNVGF